MHSRQTMMTRISLQGSCTSARRDELDGLLDRFGDDEPLEIDMHGVKEIDSTTLRALVRFQNARRAAGRSPVVIVQPSTSVRSALRITELASTFERLEGP